MQNFLSDTSPLSCEYTNMKSFLICFDIFCTYEYILLGTENLAETSGLPRKAPSIPSDLSKIGTTTATPAKESGLPTPSGSRLPRGSKEATPSEDRSGLPKATPSKVVSEDRLGLPKATPSKVVSEDRSGLPKATPSKVVSEDRSGLPKATPSKVINQVGLCLPKSKIDKV